MDAPETAPNHASQPRALDAVALSIVVIGYNEESTIGACLESAHRAATAAGIAYELIYVDGGSRDASLDIARAIPEVRVLGGDRPRRAAENRNLGLRHARGTFVQFVDGDMVLDPAWIATARDYLQEHPQVGIVYGRLREANQSRLFQALQHDWAPVTGEVPFCGGAATHRRDVIEKVGGFPEDVGYGEEPYMCWRIRREQNVKIVQLEAPMALHDLGHRSFKDYWRQHVRNGSAYIEIATRCFRSDDKLWLREVVSIVAWNTVLVLWVVVIAVAPWLWKAVALAVAMLVLSRKAIQGLRAGMRTDVAVVYALHTYFAKLPLGWGVVKWIARRPALKS